MIIQWLGAVGMNISGCVFLKECLMYVSPTTWLVLSGYTSSSMASSHPFKSTRPNGSALGFVAKFPCASSVIEARLLRRDAAVTTDVSPAVLARACLDMMERDGDLKFESAMIDCSSKSNYIIFVSSQCQPNT